MSLLDEINDVVMGERAIPPRQLAERIADELFVNGMGEHADRLVLWDDGRKRDLGGWCRSAVVDRITACLEWNATP